jgi:hypothetical protein
MRAGTHPISVRHHCDTAFLFFPRHRCGQEVIGLITARLRVREPAGRDEAQQNFELIHQFVVGGPAAW